MPLPLCPGCHRTVIPKSDDSCPNCGFKGVEIPSASASAPSETVEGNRTTSSSPMGKPSTDIGPQTKSASRPFLPRLVKRVAVVLIALAIMSAIAFMPLFDCPMCGNPPTTALRHCYCMSSGKINLLGRFYFANHREEILDAMGYCAVCQKRMAIGRLKVPDKDGSLKEIIVCSECAKPLMQNSEQPNERK